MTTTWQLYKRHQFRDVPTFVTLQMIFLNMNWPLSVAYSSLMIYENERGLEGEGMPANSLATTASFFLLIHEWLFTDQFLRATQLLDRQAIEQGAESFEIRVKIVNKRVNWLSFSYYMICFVWAVICVSIGNFTFRMSKFILIAFQTLVFLYCLLRLRTMTNEVAKH